MTNSWKSYSEFVDGLRHRDGVNTPLPVLILGVIGEAYEVDQAGTQAELTKELGDCLWYLTAAWLALDLNVQAQVSEDLAEGPRGLSLRGTLGDLAEATKKYEWHGGPKEAVVLALQGTFSSLVDRCHAHELLLSEVRNANMEKLRKRYPNGFVVGGGVR